MKSPAATSLRNLPSVSKCLQSEAGKELQEKFGTGITTTVLRNIIDALRHEVQSDSQTAIPELQQIVCRAAHEVERIVSPAGRRAINATGILLHTGLGRAPLSNSALKALAGFGHYSLLEVDLESGDRGKRETRVESLLQALTGCEAALVVNNNAAATFLILRAVARGKEVIVSRGQLIEIGGSFRLPDVMTESGCRLKEVGTTNRTHLKDYARALSDQTGAIIHVHTSNYRIQGFTDSPGIAELCELGAKHNCPVIDDMGSGALVPLAEFGLPDEMLVRDSIAAGAALSCFSGDKLICGPQAGIICGKREIVDRLRTDPYFRMFRPDKMTLAALEATLIHFFNGDEYKREIPLYQMLARSPDELTRMAERLQRTLGEIPKIKLSIAADSSYAGGGALPDQALPTKVLRIDGPGSGWATEISRKLRLDIPSVFCRIQSGGLLFDMRTLLAGDEDGLADALKKVLS